MEIFGGLQLQSLPLRDAIEAIIRGYLQLIDSDDSRNAVLALVRSAVSNEPLAQATADEIVTLITPVIEQCLA